MVSEVPVVPPAARGSSPAAVRGWGAGLGPTRRWGCSEGCKLVRPSTWAARGGRPPFALPGPASSRGPMETQGARDSQQRGNFKPPGPQGWHYRCCARAPGPRRPRRSPASCRSAPPGPGSPSGRGAAGAAGAGHLRRQQTRGARPPPASLLPSLPPPGPEEDPRRAPHSRVPGASPAPSSRGRTEPGTMAWTPGGGRMDGRGRWAGAAPRAAPPSGRGPRLRRSATCRSGGAASLGHPSSGRVPAPWPPPAPRVGARSPWGGRDLAPQVCLGTVDPQGVWGRGRGRGRGPVERGVWILLPSPPPCTVPGCRGGSQQSRGNSPGDGDRLHLRPVQHNLPLSKSVLIFKHLA